VTFCEQVQVKEEPRETVMVDIMEPVRTRPISIHVGGATSTIAGARKSLNGTIPLAVSDRRDSNNQVQATVTTDEGPSQMANVTHAHEDRVAEQMKPPEVTPPAAPTTQKEEVFVLNFEIFIYLYHLKIASLCPFISLSST